jgi:hypothetical protein
LKLYGLQKRKEGFKGNLGFLYYRMEAADILRIIHDYNYNQDRYNRNMSSLIGLIRDARRDDSRSNSSAAIDIFALLPSFRFFDFSGSIIDPSGSVLDPSGSRPGLSAEEIENGTSTYGYQILDNTPHICPITLEVVNEGEAVTKINRCGHIFKEAALRRWFENHSRCPVCRGNV